MRNKYTIATTAKKVYAIPLPAGAGAAWEASAIVGTEDAVATGIYLISNLDTTITYGIYETPTDANDTPATSDTLVELAEVVYSDQGDAGWIG
mgnify:CR=1 FL=1